METNIAIRIVKKKLSIERWIGIRRTLVVDSLIEPQHLNRLSFTRHGSLVQTVLDYLYEKIIDFCLF